MDATAGQLRPGLCPPSSPGEPRETAEPSGAGQVWAVHRLPGGRGVCPLCWKGLILEHHHLRISGGREAETPHRRAPLTIINWPGTHSQFPEKASRPNVGPQLWAPSNLTGSQVSSHPTVTHSSAPAPLAPNPSRAWLYDRTIAPSHHKPHGWAERHTEPRGRASQPKALAFTLQVIYPPLPAGTEWPASENQ